MIRGFDVSSYQRKPDWPTLTPRYGLDFIIAKVSEGNSYTDASWTWNRDQGHKAGLKVGGYHFARPESSSAATQARRFVGLAGNVDMLVLDLEQSQLSQSATNAWMRSFGDALRQLAPGVTTTAYLGGYAANGSGQGSVDHFDHWWYPRYPGLSTWPSVYDPRAVVQFRPTTGFAVPPAPSIWQFSDRIGGMDANVSNLTVEQLFGGTPTPSKGAANVFSLQKKGDSAKWISDSQTRRHVPNETAWLDLVNAGVVSGSPVLVDTDLQLTDVGGPVALDPLDADALAAAIVAKLPPSSTGGITQDQVKQALKDALKEGTS